MMYFSNTINYAKTGKGLIVFIVLPLLLLLMMMMIITIKMMTTMIAILVELLGLLRWKAEPNKVFHCIDNLLKLDGLEIMKVCFTVYLLTAHLFDPTTATSTTYCCCFIN